MPIGSSNKNKTVSAEILQEGVDGIAVRNRRITVSYGRTVGEDNYGSSKYHLSMGVDVPEKADVDETIRNEYEFIKEIVEDLIDEAIN